MQCQNEQREGISRTNLSELISKFIHVITITVPCIPWLFWPHINGPIRWRVGDVTVRHTCTVRIARGSQIPPRVPRIILPVSRVINAGTRSHLLEGDGRSVFARQSGVGVGHGHTAFVWMILSQREGTTKSMIIIVLGR
jgi:hypothetical protein